MDSTPVPNDENRREQKNEIKKELIRTQKKKNISFKWPLTALILSFVISISIALLSEFLLSDTGIIVTVILIIVILCVAFLTDIVGVAITAANIEPFMSMASKKIRGSKEAINMIKNADKYSSFFCDIIGDVCGTLCGALGASLVILFSINGEMMLVFISALVSSIIATLTVFGKAIGKNYAINNSNKIVFLMGKIASCFKK